MKAKEWETKKRSSKGSLSHTVTSYIHPFSHELIVLGIIWGKSPCRSYAQIKDGRCSSPSSIHNFHFPIRPTMRPCDGMIALLCEPSF